MNYTYKVGDTIAASDFGEWSEGKITKINPSGGPFSHGFEVEIRGWAGPLIWYYNKESLLPIKTAREEKNLKVTPPWEGEFIGESKRETIKKIHKDIMKTP